MSSLVKAGGAVTGVGAIATALISPVVVWVVGVLALMALGALVVVALTAARTRDEVRHERSMAVLNRVLPRMTGGTSAPAALPPDSTADPPAPRPRRQPWRRRPSST
jgi:hypothetical protein